jgi:hypothetical protein
MKESSKVSFICALQTDTNLWHGGYGFRSLPLLLLGTCTLRGDLASRSWLLKELAVDRLTELALDLGHR